MVGRSAHLSRNRYQFGKSKMLPVFGSDAKPYPGCAAVTTNPSVSSGLLQRCERGTHAYQESWTIHCEQLLFRVVEVVHIHGLQPEIHETLSKLVRQESSGDRMSTSSYLVGRHDAGREQRVLKPLIVRLARRGWRSIGCDIPALGADNHLVSPDFPGRNRLLNSVSHGALRSLAPVVARRVHDIDARNERLAYAHAIALILIVRTIPQVRANAQCTDRQFAGKRTVKVKEVW